MKRFPAMALAAQFAALFLCASAFAAPDEIEVYDSDINKTGQWGLEVHTNYVTDGATSTADGTIPPRHVFRLTPELSYGLTETVELGAYQLAMTDPQGRVYSDGQKLRVKYLPFQGETYAGVNIELGYVSDRFSPSPWEVEVRPILGMKRGKWEIAFNPVLDMALSGDMSQNPDFAPSVKIYYSLRDELEIGMEHYADLGQVNRLKDFNGSYETTYLALSTVVSGVEVTPGIGHGWTAATGDQWVLRAIFAWKF